MLYFSHKYGIVHILSRKEERIDEFYFLGLALDTNLNWIKDRENIKYGLKTTGILNRLKHVSSLHISVIISHINYYIMIKLVILNIFINGYQRNRTTSIKKKVV